MATLLKKLLSWFGSALASCLVASCVLSVARAQDELEPIRVDMRTFGWNVERSFALDGVDEPVAVQRMQFNGPYAYSGHPVLRLRPIPRSDLTENLELNQAGGPGNGAPESARAVPERPVPVDLRAFGKAPGNLLLLFLPASGVEPNRVAVFNDEAAVFDRSNVHFYNLSSRELGIRMFGTGRTVPPRDQAVWSAEDGSRASPVLVAVRDPEARIVYSSRFRLREDQRLVLMARDGTERGAGDSPVRIASFLERVRPVESGERNEAEPVEPEL